MADIHPRDEWENDGTFIKVREVGENGQVPMYRFELCLIEDSEDCVLMGNGDYSLEELKRVRRSSGIKLGVLGVISLAAAIAAVPFVGAPVGAGLLLGSWGAGAGGVVSVAGSVASMAVTDAAVIAGASAIFRPFKNARKMRSVSYNALNGRIYVKKFHKLKDDLEDTLLSIDH